MFLNKEKQEINYKITYWGYPLVGKRTSIEYIYESTSEENRGQLVYSRNPNEWGVNLECDILLRDIKIKGFGIRVTLYAVPGEVGNYKFLKKGLKDVDGVIFVANSCLEICGTCRKNHNKQQLDLLAEFLKEQGQDISEILIAVQFNRRDCKQADPIDLMRKELKVEDRPFVETIAYKGIGVFETLKSIMRLILLKTKQIDFSSIPSV